MGTRIRRTRCSFLICTLALFYGWSSRGLWAQAPGDSAASDPRVNSSNILTPQEWEAVDQSVDRALEWISRHQQPDGQFLSLDIAQPAVTSLCVLAFLSRGHLPGEGPYGLKLDAAVQFVLSCQHSDGLIAYRYPNMQMQPHNAAHTAIYNHAIASLMLCEVYGMTGKDAAPRVRSAVEWAMKFTLGRQQVPKRSPVDRGGWRYVQTWEGSDSDLSVTSWQLMFLRSAKNAGFEIPGEFIDRAMEYVHRCYDGPRRSFVYGLIGGDRKTTRAMAGAGILSLSFGGFHDTDAARVAGDWVLRHPFDPYLGDAGIEHDTRYFYGAFYCSQAMFQLGGRHWSEFYPRLASTLLSNQSKSGSWDSEPGEDAHYGRVYTSALAVLALTTPYQLLPIYQR
jgi:hypothetical protein